MVTDVSASTLPPDRLQAGLEWPQHLVTLSAIEDDGLGEERNVLWELEPGVVVIASPALASDPSLGTAHAHPLRPPARQSASRPG